MEGKGKEERNERKNITKERGREGKVKVVKESVKRC